MALPEHLIIGRYCGLSMGGKEIRTAEMIELDLAFHTPNPSQPPTEHSVKHVKLRLLVRHGPTDSGILQIEPHLIRPVSILTSPFSIRYSSFPRLPYPVPLTLGQTLPLALR